MTTRAQQPYTRTAAARAASARGVWAPASYSTGVGSGRLRVSREAFARAGKQENAGAAPGSGGEEQGAGPIGRRLEPPASADSARASFTSVAVATTHNARIPTGGTPDTSPRRLSIHCRPRALAGESVRSVTILGSARLRRSLSSRVPYRTPQSLKPVRGCVS
eukprot:scaffold8631_cov108-Isochrysis_galbana.AAC.13